jgi:2-succinyl-6-hydroxy-2,4-cyclohexadiene-1-carboxylate synthase
MQRGDSWGPVLTRVRRRYRTVAVEFDTPTLEACLATIRHHGRGGVLVGYSMGGRLALRAALADPAAYRALVLLGATPGIENEKRRRARKATDEELAAWMERSPIVHVVNHWERQPVFRTQSWDVVERQRLGRLSHDPGKLAGLLRATGQGVLPPVWDDLDKLTMPVLAAAGDRDDKYADIAQRMAEALPNGRAVRIPGVGHAAHLEDPEAFADLLLDFLDEHLGQRVFVDGDA